MSLQVIVDLIDNLTSPLGLMTAGVAAFTAALTGGIMAAVEAADKLDGLSEKTGIAASSLSEYAFAAKMSETSLDGFLAGLNKLNRSLGMSEEETSKQAAAFEALGISAKDSEGNLRSSEEMFGVVADAMSGLADTPEKAAIGFAIFGQQFKELNPLLNQGSEGIAALKAEARSLGAMAPEAFDAFAASSGHLNDGIDKLLRVFANLFTQLASEIVPILNILIEEIIKSYKEGGLLQATLTAISTVFVDVLIPALKATIVVMRGFGDVVTIAGKSLGALGAMVAAVASGDLDAASAIYKEYKADVEAVTEAHVDFTTKITTASNATDVATRALEKTNAQALKIAPTMKKVAAATKEVKSSLEEMVANLTIANKSFGLDDSVKQQLEAEKKFLKDRAAGMDPQRALALLNEASAQIALNHSLRDGAAEADAYKKAGMSLADYTAATDLMAYEATLVGKSTEERTRLLERFKEEAALRASLVGLTSEHAAAIKEDTVAAQERRDVTLKQVAATRLENEIIGQSAEVISADIRDKVDTAKRLLEEGKITTDDYVKYVRDQLQRVKDKNAEVTDEMTLFWQEAAKNMQNAVSSFFFDIMQGKFDNLGARFKSLLDKMVADALAAKLMQAMFGGFAGGGGLGGLVGNLVGGLFNGGYTAGGSAASNMPDNIDIGGGFNPVLNGARASGGIVARGQSYMVGEMGPERFVPSVTGTIVPNSAISASPARPPVNINITAMDSQDVRRALERDNRWIADLVNKSSRAYNLGV